ncbi:PaaI family thioesterase [Mesobacillus sp. AQ2]|uniref:PaaI family thioesterase n=1 Tax=unclassified Mesobacillus TaxID=2675270 RepID=UPI00203CC3DE|nr:PaaI family thioesterase [Mesobacillus sp. AQ2]MCM3123435.1 PaaI family thioesterase [Mesobacillus sp. MER 33]MCM3233082.1 PaaI family thioesterase [Mesobacillus sp. MER 48]WHX42156.1 PaaI family thioesterase [Mesobacillus sp. AQ2]
MEKDLHQLLDECISLSGEQELEALKTVLAGVKNKLSGKNSTYIDGLLHMDRRLDDQTCEIVIPITRVLDNTLGIVHGGFTATVLDTAMGTLANRLLPEGYAAVTSQLNIHFLAPGIGDKLHCKATLIHKGRSTIVLEADVFRSDGKRIAHSSGSFFVIEKQHQ